jgi:hypothetical protein
VLHFPAAHSRRRFLLCEKYGRENDMTSGEVGNAQRSAIRELEYELGQVNDLLHERTEMLFDACWALDDCLNILEDLGHHKQDELHFLSKGLLEWWRAEFARRDAHYDTQVQKYAAAMAEKKRQRVRLVK